MPPPDSGTSDPRLERFLAAVGPARPTMLLYMSTTGVYGDTSGAAVTEDSPVAPGNDRSQRRVAAESIARGWCEARAVRCIVLRVPGIYGPGRLPLERLRRRVAALQG
jgi:nucleoside-diphosphate-sugar epimerase